MESALKQRLVGALVLIALAVIFLPMLVHGPAPESGVAALPLAIPPAPDADFETRELPLAAPAAARSGGALGMQAPPLPAAAEPATDGASAQPDQAGDGMFPAATAGGDHAVTFGSFDQVASADRLVATLRASQLPGYQVRQVRDGRTVYQVLIGPFIGRATAEAARLRAAHVRDDVDARVIALDAGTAALPRPTATAPAPASAAKPVAPTAAPAAVPAVAPAPKVAAAAAAPAARPAPATTPAAADVGFAVQLGAFRNAEEAAALRARLQTSGFNAFVERVDSDAGVLHRVRVGPVFGRPQADELKAKLRAQFGIDGIVRPHL
ncbi:MAG TPA: SPOR domain-containing protein [Xanthomonadaceae bacterium]|nr:SPOR domain-containing protein [Xanthomonadaceae bacterium]